MNAHDKDGVKSLLRQTLPPIEGDAGTERDLWPAMLRRLDAESAVPAPTSAGWAWSWAWFDGVLAAGLVGLAVLFPASIPVFLYYL
jgi:hypothetical protein